MTSQKNLRGMGLFSLKKTRLRETLLLSSKSEWERAEKTEAHFSQRCTVNTEKQLT